MFFATMAVSAAVIALVAFALRFGGVCSDLAKMEAGSERLESELRAIALSMDVDSLAFKRRIAALIIKQKELREEIRNRRQPGDARSRLRMLSDQATDSDSQDR